MISNGVFPDSQTYNVLFQYLIKYEKLKEASLVFNEMIKNEFFPNKTNCNAAIKAYGFKGTIYGYKSVEMHDG